ncbi:MAG: cysteine--tRNA ligase [Candidatus Margulisbacteria bacterium]|nr:cysteine--tRNA ligase [Candidatus Margulisiibacteriota bacterium]
MKVYNTLAREKQEFKPINPPQVNMYVCGVTVYDYCHIGHARAYVVFDMIRRYLEYSGYKVKYIQNFTDIDDKIINKANQEKTEISEITKRYTEAYYKDIGALGIKEANSYPKATENIKDMIKLIGELIKKEYAYEIEGEVFFRVSKFKDYGKLSKRIIDDQEAGSRVEINKKKENPQDFTLWKPSKEKEPSWDSPWGKGRPGWHIECSVMSLKEAGIDTLDIHGGGQDLIFPHHENEIAQSEAYTGKPFAKYWLHNGFVTINKEKMSKSLGNFFTVRDVLTKYDPEVIRFFLLSTHYRSPINYSDKELTEAKIRLERLYEAINNNINNKENKKDDFSSLKKEFHEFMQDDFNSAGAIGILFKLATETNTKKSKSGAKLLKELGNILGLLQAEKKEEVLEKEIDDLIHKRIAARKRKDFTESDRIRDELLQKGVILKDMPDGSVKFERKL